MFRRPIRLIAAVAILLMAACSEKISNPPGETTIDLVTLTGAPSSLYASQTATISAKAFANGVEITGRTFTWTSSNDAIMTVNQNGVIVAVSVGAATITASTPATTSSSSATVSASASVTVTPAPMISLSAAALTFTGTAGQPAPPPQQVQITNGGTGTLAGLSLGTIDYQSGIGWLSATLTGSTAPTALQVSVVLPGPGVYSARIPIVTSTSGVQENPKYVTVTLTVGQAPTISLSASSLTFNATAGGSNPEDQLVTISNSGFGDLTGISLGPITYAPGQPTGWIVSRTLGGSTAPSTLTVRVARGSLPVGVYTATFPVTSTASGVTNSGVLVTVTLTVTAAPIISLGATTATFSGAVFGANPAQQQILVSNTGGGTLTGLSLSNISYQGNTLGNWLNATLNATTAPTSISLGVNLRPVNDYLPAGSYVASFNVVSSNPDVASSPTITVTLTLTSNTPQFVQITAGGDHTCGRTSSGVTMCWGQNFNNQLGTGTGSPQASLVPALVAGGLMFAEINAGYQHTCGRTAPGSVYCWGLNSFGQLGDGTNTSAPAPTLVSGAAVYVAITLGDGHTCGRTSTVSLCWGQGGTLGDNTLNSSFIPVQVFGGATYAELNAGGAHTCARTAAGVVSCWGNNTNGQVGDNSTTFRQAPTPVNTGLLFASVAAGVYQTCARTSANATFCWGLNASGQLGDGTLTSRSSPVGINSGQTFTSLVSGEAHTCGLTPAGIAYCWGLNDSGQLGNGGLNFNTTSPFLVSGGLVFVELTAGDRHTCGRTSAGVVYCWGRGGAGQLGNGLASDRSVPTRIP